MPANRRVGQARPAWPIVMLGLAVGLGLAACLPVTRPVVKIAFVAPFEGRYRDIGYEVTWAFRLAVREANLAGGVGGYSIEILSLDDSGDPAQAAEQARKVAADPQVAAVIGHWRESTTQAAAPVYDAAGIPLVATGSSNELPRSAYRLWLTEAVYGEAAPEARHCPLPCDSLDDLTWLSAAGPAVAVAGPVLWELNQFATLAGTRAEGAYIIAPAPLPSDLDSPTFADNYRPLSFGTEPRSNAVLAYDATRLVLRAVADAAGGGAVSRAAVASALSRADFTGLSGHISFDEQHNWEQVRAHVYQWRNGVLIQPYPR